MSPFIARVVGPVRLWRMGRARVRRSLQTRTVMFVVIVSLTLAVVFSMVSMASVRSSLLSQVSGQSRNDFSAQIEQAQRNLDSADTSAYAQYQQLVNDLAATLQNEGASNLVGVYVWNRSSSGRSIVPVSTDPTYTGLISDEIRVDVAGDTAGSVYYQPVALSGDGGKPVPGAVLGTTLQFSTVGDLSIFGLYSYETQQTALQQIQTNLILISVLLSIVMGLLIWYVLHGIVNPVERVAVAAETLAAGDLDVRVDVNRKDEIGTLQRSFNEMAGELEHADKMRRDMIANVSHELRTPVSALQAMVENMADGVTEASPANLESILDQTHRLSDLIAFLLDLSRMEAGAASLNIERFNLHDFLDETIKPLEIADAGHAHDILMRVDAGIEMEGDQDRLRQLFTNIIANALKHSANGTTVLVEAREDVDAGMIVTNVVNFGSQIPVSDRSDIFRRFVKGKAGPGTESGGTGLGLSIARWAAQLHGGTVDSCGDHRIAMCAAVAATRCAGEVTILHGECVEKSYPRFYEDYRQLGGIANVIVLES